MRNKVGLVALLVSCFVAAWAGSALAATCGGGGFTGLSNCRDCPTIGSAPYPPNTTCGTLVGGNRQCNPNVITGRNCCFGSNPPANGSCSGTLPGGGPCTWVGIICMVDEPV
jgi:hypothetical protein